MTLLIALIANEGYAHVAGEPYIANGWIVVLWIVHIAFHEGRK